MIQYRDSYSDGSKTRSRQLRRDVRSELGTGNDPLPDLLAVLRAARALGALLDNASGGRFGIAVHDFNPPAWDTGKGEQAIPVGTAIQYVLTAREVERQRQTYGCTGGIDSNGQLVHDGDTCPVHEA